MKINEGGVAERTNSCINGAVYKTAMKLICSLPLSFIFVLCEVKNLFLKYRGEVRLVLPSRQRSDTNVIEELQRIEKRWINVGWFDSNLPDKFFISHNVSEINAVQK